MNHFTFPVRPSMKGRPRSLYEEYLAQSPSDPSVDYWQGLIRQAVFLRIDNVAHHFYEEDDREYWDYESDFPNLAPPWPVFWMEHLAPRRVYSSEKGERVTPASLIGSSAGYLFMARDVRAHDDWQGMTLGQLSSDTLRHALEAVNIRWFVEVAPFLRTAFVPAFQEGMGYVLFIGEDGTTRKLAGRNMGAYAYDPRMDAHALKLMIDNATGLLGPCLLSLCYLHCKNVEIKERGPISRKVAPRHATEREGWPGVRHHVLHIEPMRRVLKSEGGESHNGLKRAMHICRRHFKTFTEERPLFGKVSGTFLWEMHTRGDPRRGTVTKDYDIHNPPEAPHE